MSAKLKFNVVHSRCTNPTAPKDQQEYINTNIGAVLQIGDRFVLKLNYLPPAGDLCNLWAPKPKVEEPAI